MRRFTFPLLLALCAFAIPARAEENERGDGVAAKPAARSTKVKKRTVRRGNHELGWAVPEEKLRATPAPPPSGAIKIYSLNHREELDVNIYNEDGSYNPESLVALRHFFRCPRTETEKKIDPRLITVLSQIYDHYGGARLELLSGYRNQRRVSSNHYKGMAADIRVAGVHPRVLRDFIETLDSGGMGVGYYPRTLFVHVDVRPLPSYRWLDWSRSNPDSPDKLPPRGWRKKLRS